MRTAQVSTGRSGPNGTYLPANRRCKTPEEMQADGMQRNRRGLWVTKAFGNASPFAPRSRFGEVRV